MFRTATLSILFLPCCVVLAAPQDNGDDFVENFELIEKVLREMTVRIDELSKKGAETADLREKLERLTHRFELTQDYRNLLSKRLDATQAQMDRVQRQVNDLTKQATSLNEEIRGRFEDFSEVKPAQIPKGWSGKGLMVQDIGGRNALQLREIGSGVVTVPQKLVGDFFLETEFSTYGYVNKPRGIDVVIEDANRRPIVRVSVLDRYPNLNVNVNGTGIRPHTQLTSRLPNRLEIERRGGSVRVKINGQSVHATRASRSTVTTARISLRNDRDEYGRADQSRFPTIYSLRTGPLRAE